ncbi:PIN domain-like protein [Tuber brumale]|nr:PIN domain-like protein [Tuber brumale]
MGISGLLVRLGSIQRKNHIKEWNGTTVGIDAYSWLHKGVIGCAIELAQGKHTRGYVEYALSRVHMLRHFGVTPYMVFDGDYLPSKSATEAEREKRRKECRAKGLELLRLRKMKEAQEQLQKSIDVTPLMARHLIDECKRIGVECIVAPYEADAQLYYLEKTGIIQGIVAEDSDLLAFGCKNLITKMDKFGDCWTIDRDDFTAIRGSGFSLSGWTDTEFRYMCILSGCDYLPNIPRLGLLGAYKLVKRHKTPERIIKSVRFDATKTVPVNYLDGFRRANLTFLHQWVFCPKAEKMVMVTEPDAGVDKQYLDGCGKELDAETARGIACGDLDPATKKPFVLDSIVESAIRSTDSAWMKPKMRILESSQSFTSIANFFKPRVEPPKTPLQEKSVNIKAGNPIRSEPQIKLKPSTPATNKRLFSQFEVKTDEPTKRPRLFPDNVLEDFNVTGERSSFFSRRAPPPGGRSNRKRHARRVHQVHQVKKSVHSLPLSHLMPMNP